MHLCSKSRLAVDALVDLASRQHTGPVALFTISEHLKVSQSWLEQLFSGLRRRGLVRSTRGPGGGYRLGADAAEITVADIVRAVADGSEAPQDGRAGPARALSLRLEALLLDAMDRISLASLLPGAGAAPQPASAAPRRKPLHARPPLPLQCVAPNSVFAFAQGAAA
jgi:Rrf2 family iron-sulfur cluster assembly transcriptional regulator